MLSRVPTSLLAALVLTLVGTATASAQVLSQPLDQPRSQYGVAPAVGQPAANEQVQISDAALQPQIEKILAKGRAHEAKKQWAEALSTYEDGVREYPGEARLQQRFDFARINFSLGRRYHDASFVKSVQTLGQRDANELYRDLLRKIDSHYVVSPPWRQIASRGVVSLQVALTQNAFRHYNGLRASSQQTTQLKQEIRQRLANHRGFNSYADLMRFSSDIARLASQRVGLSSVATTLEFTAAAADGLDHYSSFLTPDQLREVYSQIEGNFVGLGVELKADAGALLIVRVIPNSPAEKAGIRSGDRITAVDGKETASMSTDDAAGMLTGEEGSIVRVTLASSNAPHLVAKPTGNNWQRPASASRVINVQRAHVDVPSLEEVGIVDADYGVAYVRIPVFQKTTSRDLDKALWDLHRQGMRSLVLDLRGNPGGLLTSSVELADKFVAQGNLVSTRGRSEGEDFDYRAHRAGTWRVPLVVLIDGDSASASEIFAAAIRDNRRGTIVGVRSFGKGSVQGIFPLGHGGAGIRLTTAKFFSPNGQPISKVGVSPDIVVRHAKSSTEGTYVTGFRGAGDAQSEGQTDDLALSKAVETAKRQVALR